MASTAFEYRPIVLKSSGEPYLGWEESFLPRYLVKLYHLNSVTMKLSRHVQKRAHRYLKTKHP